MAFGWTEPNREHDHMLNADVAVTGFTEEGVPFADDYYITKYSECMKNDDDTVEGVCPDTMYNASNSVNSVNNTRLVYAHRKDGVSFVRYQRPLKTVDKSLIKPPDSIRPFYLPQNHGKTYGHVHINVSERINDCFGPLDAEDKEDQELVIADKKEPIIVTSGPPLHYPNPPNPSKILYLNKKESPVLRVERGVPVKFSIQAGHDVAFYITSDPLGGNATSRNMSETVYIGGPEAQGVQSSPKELTWAPDRNTPDHVYYQSVFTQKMGWKVQVVDGGLTDMYKNSVLLDDQQVNFFWTLSVSEKSISIAARGEKKSGYLAIGFGSEMEKSFAYVGWVDLNGTGRVNTYWIDGMNAQSLHPTSENLTYVRCKSENGVITLEFTRPLDPNCNRKERIEFKSNKPVRVSLIRGSAEAEEDLRPVLAVHGFMMFLAWGMFLPAGILAARYTKHLPGDIWFKPINAYFRPKKPETENPSTKRVIWEYIHTNIGRCSIFVGISALITGMKHLGERYNDENTLGLTWALIVWVSLGALTVVYLEFIKRRRQGMIPRGNWVLGNGEDEDADLLSSNGNHRENGSVTSEIQLEPVPGSGGRYTII
ncbi:hypothetical protein R6Q59_019156 [Mikania micrantha]